MGKFILDWDRRYAITGIILLLLHVWGESSLWSEHLALFCEKHRYCSNIHVLWRYSGMLSVTVMQRKIFKELSEFEEAKHGITVQDSACSC